LNEEEPLVDRVVASGSLKKGLQPRATPQRTFNAVTSLLVALRGRPRHPVLVHRGCGRRVAVALRGGRAPSAGLEWRGYEKESCDASRIATGATCRLIGQEGPAFE
jgi:hypothetical protein